jgi:hypothetical protein
MNYFTLARRKHPYLRALKGSPTMKKLVLAVIEAARRVVSFSDAKDRG